MILFAFFSVKPEKNNRKKILLVLTLREKGRRIIFRIIIWAFLFFQFYFKKTKKFNSIGSCFCPFFLLEISFYYFLWETLKEKAGIPSKNCYILNIYY